MFNWFHSLNSGINVGEPGNGWDPLNPDPFYNQYPIFSIVVQTPNGIYDVTPTTTWRPPSYSGGDDGELEFELPKEAVQKTDGNGVPIPMPPSIPWPQKYKAKGKFDETEKPKSGNSDPDESGDPPDINDFNKIFNSFVESLTAAIDESNPYKADLDAHAIDSSQITAHIVIGDLLFYQREIHRSIPYVPYIERVDGLGEDAEVISGFSFNVPQCLWLIPPAVTILHNSLEVSTVRWSAQYGSALHEYLPGATFPIKFYRGVHSTPGYPATELDPSKPFADGLDADHYIKSTFADPTQTLITAEDIEMLRAGTHPELQITSIATMPPLLKKLNAFYQLHLPNRYFATNGYAGAESHWTTIKPFNQDSPESVGHVIIEIKIPANAPTPDDVADKVVVFSNDQGSIPSEEHSNSINSQIFDQLAIKNDWGLTTPTLKIGDTEITINE